ncbi:Uncharacterized protein TCM_021370 [Theobroma cacao]|uniref:Uncharacterized protein n=1 Tax=Theobroma cacao TaxID=3641 RepID=A0A061EWW1_THECC|nr:Uncharacterized protein TCM_021370 [Theobroma cacao]
MGLAELTTWRAEKSKRKDIEAKREKERDAKESEFTTWRTDVEGKRESAKRPCSSRITFRRLLHTDGSKYVDSRRLSCIVYCPRFSGIGSCVNLILVFAKMLSVVFVAFFFLLGRCFRLKFLLFVFVLGFVLFGFLFGEVCLVLPRVINEV